MTFFLGLVPTFFFVATGGAGLITTPSLIMMGLSPQAAIATDLFAMFGGRLGGLIGLRNFPGANSRLSWGLASTAALGALGGTVILISVDESIMKKMLGIFLLLILTVILFRPEIGVDSRQPSKARRYLGYLVFYLVGTWGGFVGAGFATLGSTSLLLIFRKTFIESATVMMVVGLAVGFVTFLAFWSQQLIDWPIGISLLLGKSIGGYLGARFALKLGDKWIRGGFILIVLTASVMLLTTG
ncbi:MAG: sulfite exporter TauE/SafE family protein [bacterium]